VIAVKKFAVMLLLAVASGMCFETASSEAAGPTTTLRSTASRLRFVAPTKKPTPGVNIGINPQPLPPRYFIKK